jgi:hypothetical protein
MGRAAGLFMVLVIFTAAVRGDSRCRQGGLEQGWIDIDIDIIDFDIAGCCFPGRCWRVCPGKQQPLCTARRTGTRARTRFRRTVRSAQRYSGCGIFGLGMRAGHEVNIGRGRTEGCVGELIRSGMQVGVFFVVELGKDKRWSPSDIVPVPSPVSYPIRAPPKLRTRGWDQSSIGERGACRWSVQWSGPVVGAQ